MILPPSFIQQAENAAFAAGISPRNLMEKAGKGLAGVVHQFFPRPGRCAVFCGKGNNAGDALVAARYLAEAGWEISVNLAFPKEEMSELAREKLDELGATARQISDALESTGVDIVLDGLLGLGAHGLPREPIAAKILEICRLRSEGQARVIAVDAPSGLDLETGAHNPELCVRADITVTFGACKTGLVADAATNFVGRLAVVPLPELGLPTDGEEMLATPPALRTLLPLREFDTHKGRYGHVAIIGGSMGYFGAARMAAIGALRAGAGLVTVLAKQQNYAYLALGMPEEVMVRPVETYRDVLKEEFDAIVLGPGLANEPAPEFLEIIRMADVPMVLDAGAFDILGGNLKVLRLVSAPRILTPHPGEFSRIHRPEATTRAEIVREFVDEYPSVLLLKGARTVISAPGRPIIYNSTGNPGMATGGMGDVLAGVIGGLCTQGLRPTDAAVLGAWLCGRAAELAITHGESEESLTATLIPRFLGQAFQALRQSGW